MSNMTTGVKCALFHSAMISATTNQYNNDCISPAKCIPNNEKCGIREVWKHNLEEEFGIIRIVVQKFQYVSVDTEFPGVVARPVGEFRDSNDFHYHVLRCNVNILKIIQLGLSFMDKDGNTPLGYSAWQFNFKFDLPKEMCAQSSIDMLIASGLQFEKHESEGIDPFEFAELLMTSGVVLMDDIKFITFHSDYDFGYILKMLINDPLPIDEGEFFDLIRLFFPNIFDVKCLAKPFKKFKGSGLQEVADQLEVNRIGRAHQAGSDALLTGKIFFKMKKLYHDDEIPGEAFNGLIYGLSYLKEPIIAKDEDSKDKEQCDST